MTVSPPQNSLKFVRIQRNDCNILSIIWLMLTIDKSPVVTCKLCAVIFNLFLMNLNWSYMVFFVAIYCRICVSCSSPCVISYSFKTSSLSKYSWQNCGHIVLTVHQDCNMRIILTCLFYSDRENTKSFILFSYQLNIHGSNKYGHEVHSQYLFC